MVVAAADERRGRCTAVSTTSRLRSGWRRARDDGGSANPDSTTRRHGRKLPFPHYNVDNVERRLLPQCVCNGMAARERLASNELGWEQGWEAVSRPRARSGIFRLFRVVVTPLCRSEQGRLFANVHSPTCQRDISLKDTT